MSFNVPLTDLKLHEVDVDAVLGVLAQGWQPTGERTAAFERAFADYLDVPSAVAVNSGTAALHLAMLAAGIGPGDEVLVPAFTFVATAAAVRYCGAEPVLCDVVDPLLPLLDPADAAARITSRTRAIVAVHMFGFVADMTALKALCAEHDLLLIEDSAQAIGARFEDGTRAGTAGDAGCFSLFSKKQLCTGEGGMVVGSGALADRVRLLRSPAFAGADGPGVPLGLDEPHAALGLSRLTRLEADLDGRRAAVRAYRERLAGVPGLELPFDSAAVAGSSNFAFIALAPSRAARDVIRAGLAERGIQTTWYPALGMFSEYADAPRLERATEASERHYALPLSSSTTVEQVDTVVEALLEVAG